MMRCEKPLPVKKWETTCGLEKDHEGDCAVGRKRTNYDEVILKQAREALENVAQELHHINAGPVKDLDDLIAEVEDAIAALAAFDSLPKNKGD